MYIITCQARTSLKVRLLSSRLVDPLEPEALPREVRFSVAEDLIPSARRTAETALEQVMRFLEMRCEQA